MRVIAVYDDTGKKSEVISDIIGDKGFGDVVVKRRHLNEYYREELYRLFPELAFRDIHSVFEYPELLAELELYSGSNTKVIHCFSNYLISDRDKAALSFKKLEFVDEPYAALDGKRAVAAMFPDVASYISFLKTVIAGQKPWDLIREMKYSFPIEGLVDIGEIGNFIQCVTGEFDSRYFNSLKSSEYTLTKSSSDKQKIKAEYTFYHLLPESMRYWFVMPFDYRETEDEASYTMERLYMTDLAIKWVHGSMDEAEFEALMEKYFFFFRSRQKKECSAEEYWKIADELYVEKVRTRIESLKHYSSFEKIDALLKAGGETDLDGLTERYFALKEQIESKTEFPKELVIGHGDPCFANALYNKTTRTLKFIDPKGAFTEEELWTNPYYDVAKLSHSVCGRYDFFNNALFDIRVGSDFSLDLEIPFDNSVYQEIFRRRLAENGYDYRVIRLYEASLFLSMLPLHIDNPHKVLGFILNVKHILEELEEEL